MTYRELVYMCLDEIKASSDDAYVTEDHILFLISKYRNLVLRRKYEKTNMPVAESNYQYLLLGPGDTLPALFPIAKPVVELHFEENDSTRFLASTYVPHHRFKYVGSNLFLTPISYCTRNPYTNTLEYKVNTDYDITLNGYKIYAVFEDIIEASKTALENDTDILDADCPIETELIPEVQELVVKDILGIAYRPQDKINNGSDDLNLVNAQKSK